MIENLSRHALGGCQPEFIPDFDVGKYSDACASLKVNLFQKYPFGHADFPTTF
jgi:hypothetical protein